MIDILKRIEKINEESKIINNEKGNYYDNNESYNNLEIRLDILIDELKEMEENNKHIVEIKNCISRLEHIKKLFNLYRKK